MKSLNIVPSVKSVPAFLYIHRFRIFKVILDESSGIDFSLLQASNLRVVKQRSQFIVAGKLSKRFLQNFNIFKEDKWLIPSDTSKSHLNQEFQARVTILFHSRSRYLSLSASKAFLHIFEAYMRVKRNKKAESCSMSLYYMLR